MDKLSRKKLNMRGKSALHGFWFVLPYLIGLVVVTLYPLIYSLVISVNSVSIQPTGIELVFKGLEYYKDALLTDAEFPTLLLESIKDIAISTPLIVVFSLIIAMLLNRKFKGRTVFRVIYFLPVVIMSGPLMTQLLSETSAMSLKFDFFTLWNVFKMLPYVLRKPIFEFLNNILIILWFSGVQTIIFLAALQKVDRSMYEAASIDGAGKWEMFWRITIPHLSPIILINTIYTIIDRGTFANNPVNLKIAKHVTNDIARPFSYSAAMSWLYTAVLLVIIIIAFLLLREKKEN